MSFHIKVKSKKNISLNRAIKVVVVFFVFVYFMSKVFPNFFFNVFEPIAKPFWDIRESVTNSIGGFFAFVGPKKNLIDENNKLKQELSEANILLLNIEVLQNENNILKNGFASTSLKMFPARILTRPSESPYDILILDTGDKTANRGEKVFGTHGVLLGEIIETNKSKAKVRLYSSPGVETDAQLVKNGATLTLTGTGSGNFKVVVPKDLKITIGDSVIVPSMSSHILARVGSIEVTEADSFQKVFLTYPLNIFEMSWVEISNGE